MFLKLHSPNAPGNGEWVVQKGPDELLSFTKNPWISGAFDRLFRLVGARWLSGVKLAWTTDLVGT